MRKRCIGGLLALMMAVSLCACSSNNTDSSKKEAATEAVTTEVKAEEETSAGETDDAVLQEVKSKNLPVGYIADDGYYNSYFGFKITLSEGQADFDTSRDTFGSVFIAGMNNAETKDGTPLEDAIEASLESNGHALVYTTDYGSVTVDGEKVSFEITVGKKTEGQTNDEVIEAVKGDCKNTYSIEDADISQTKVEFAGKIRDCLSWTKEEDTSRAKILCFEGDYACMISLSGMSSLDKASSILEEF